MATVVVTNSRAGISENIGYHKLGQLNVADVCLGIICVQDMVL